MLSQIAEEGARRDVSLQWAVSRDEFENVLRQDASAFINCNPAVQGISHLLEGVLSIEVQYKGKDVVNSERANMLLNCLEA